MSEGPLKKTMDGMLHPDDAFSEPVKLVPICLCLDTSASIARDENHGD